MSTNDSHKLTHSAMVKNASPHMNGGGPHIQKQQRPQVMTNDGLTVKRPPHPSQAQGVRPVKKIRMENGQPTREVEVTGGVMPAATPEGEGVNKFGKRMIKVRMDNGRAKPDNGRTPGGKMQRVALPGRGSMKSDPRFANLQRQKQQRLIAAGLAPAPYANDAAPVRMMPGMSNEQLMLCRYTVKKYAEAENNELTSALCAGTIEAIDKIMAAQKGEPIEVAAPAPEIEPEPEPVAIEEQPEPEAPLVTFDANGQPQLTAEQLAELDQFEEQQQARSKMRAQGAVKPFGAPRPAKPVIDTEPEPDGPKSE